MRLCIQDNKIIFGIIVYQLIWQDEKVKCVMEMDMKKYVNVVRIAQN